MSWSRAVRRSIITALTCAGISIFYSGINSRQRDWFTKGGAYLERRSTSWWILTNTADQRISCLFGKQPEKSLEMNKVQTCKSAILCPSLLTVVVHWLNEFYGWWVLWSHFWDFVVAFCVCVIGTKIGYFSPILMWIIGTDWWPGLFAAGILLSGWINWWQQIHEALPSAPVENLATQVHCFWIPA